LPKKPSLTIELKEKRDVASGEVMDAFERDTGTKIPADYRKFLACQNGGAPLRRNFSFGEKAYQDSVLRYFLGVACPLKFDLKFTLEEYQSRLPKNTFPIAVDEFDNLVLISRQRGTTNQILFWDHEKERQRNPTVFVAANLIEFLTRLEEDKVEQCDVATITFDDGETCRRVLPSKFFSKDRNNVIEVRDCQIGEQIEEFGESKTIARIEFSREKKIV